MDGAKLAYNTDMTVVSENIVPTIPPEADRATLLVRVYLLLVLLLRLDFRCVLNRDVANDSTD
jgi:hypothetical protein